MSAAGRLEYAHSGIAVYRNAVRGVFYVEADEGYCSECMEELLATLEHNEGLHIDESDDRLPEITANGVRLYLKKKGAA